ncbi:hypothetical protein AEQU1_00614 [Aequorivita sp. CIP111184]|nr:hypothetical protein AEQU1_00614 [Aequorivita sp. CIP111184]
MKYFLFIILLSSLGCKEQPKDNYELNIEVQQSKTEIHRLEKINESLNESLNEQLEKCSDFVNVLVDN